MNRNYYWMLLTLMLFAAAFYACGGGDDDSTDGDADGDSDGKAFTEVCTADSECAGNFCFLGSVSSYCTMPCYSDADCEEARPAGQVLDACCRKVEGQNLCQYAGDCGGNGDGDLEGEDGDIDSADSVDAAEEEVEIAEGLLCGPGTFQCSDNWIQRCQSDGLAWEDYLECTYPNICQGGQCVPDSVDGDKSDICAGDVVPAPIYGSAESKWNQAKSTAIIAEIYETAAATEFGDRKYVRLNSVEAGQKLAFNLDVDTSYYYDIYIDYVKMANWGEASLYLNDSPDPILLTESYHPNSRISLHDPNLTTPGSEKRIKNVTYQPICIPAGEHILYVKVYGKESNSSGYTLGVDYIAALPHVDETPEDGDK